MSFVTRPIGLVSRRTFSTTAPSQLAKLAVIGRLAAQPELNASSNGREYVRYTIVSNHGSKQTDRACFWNVISFPRTESSRDFYLGLPKGALVHVDADAELQQNVDEETGKKVPRLLLTQRTLDVLARPKNTAEKFSPEEHQAAAA